MLRSHAHTRIIKHSSRACLPVIQTIRFGMTSSHIRAKLGFLTAYILSMRLLIVRVRTSARLHVPLARDTAVCRARFRGNTHFAPPALYYSILVRTVACLP